MQRKFHTEDTFIVQDIIDGKRVFSEILDAHQKDMYYYILRVLAFDSQLARDIIIEVFSTAYKNLHAYSSKISLKCWLYQIAYNKLKKIIQQSRDTLIKPSSELSIRLKNIELDAMEHMDIDMLISHLIPTHRHMLILTQVFNFDSYEIASIMRVSESQVINLQAEVRNQLKNLVLYG